MFVRVVSVKEYQYMQVVQNVRIKGKAPRKGRAAILPS